MLTALRFRACDLQGSNPLSHRFARRYAPRCTGTMGFEPTTVGLEVRRSIQTELRALVASLTVIRHKEWDSCYPSNRYSEVTYGRRLNIQRATGSPTMVTARKAATFAQNQLNHQPTRTK